MTPEQRDSVRRGLLVLSSQTESQRVKKIADVARYPRFERITDDQLKQEVNRIITHRNASPKDKGLAMGLMKVITGKSKPHPPYARVSQRSIDHYLASLPPRSDHFCWQDGKCCFHGFEPFLTDHPFTES